MKHIFGKALEVHEKSDFVLGINHSVKSDCVLRSDHKCENKVIEVHTQVHEQFGDLDPTFSFKISS